MLLTRPENRSPHPLLVGGGFALLWARLGGIVSRMDFDDLVAMLRDPQADVQVPATIYDDLTNVYRETRGRGDELEGRVAQHEAALAAKDGRIMELEGKISKLTADNYKLLMTKPANNQQSADNGNDDNDRPEGIDGLFGKGK